jgi:hypothetical protein
MRDKDVEGDFKYPFNDLMLWAVLTRRHSMARCMFMYGEQAMAKCLVAIRLYKCMSKLAAYDCESKIHNKTSFFKTQRWKCQTN